MNIWRILGIEETKDKNAIQNAYRDCLMKTNPEDDPEGFQRLRNAYEEALAFADRKEGNDTTWEDTPIGNYMKKVEQCYTDFQKRIDIACWQELLTDDLVIALDTKDAVCENLLAFFMSHHLVPHPVWKLLAETFSLEEDKEILAEKFPRDFLDYILNNARYEDTISYYDFEEKDSDLLYDDYISTYLQLHGMLQRRELEKAEPLMDELRSMGLTHPQGKVEYVRFLLQKEEIELASYEAEAIVEEYEDKWYVKLMMAELCWKKEDFEACKGWYQKILDQDPKHYGARCGMAECMMQDGEYEKAKKIFKDLLNINRFDDFVHRCMMECNEQLTAYYEEKVAQNASDYASAIELVWCYYQNYHFDQAKELLDRIPVPQDYYIMDYQYLCGRVKLQLENYEEALAAFESWLVYYGQYKHFEGDLEVMNRNHDRIGLTNFFIAEVYSEMAEAKKDLLLYEKAMKYNEEAMKYPDLDMGMFLTQHAILANKLSRYEEAIHYAQLAIKEEQNNFEAYLQIGEACCAMEMYQEALDSYQNATAYCPYYVKPYIEQIKLYLQFDAIERAQDVVDRFLETDTPSLWIKVYQSKIARARQDYEQAKCLMDEVEAGLRDSEQLQDIPQKDVVYHEKALVHYYLQEYDDSVECLEKALELAPKCARYHYFMGNLMWEQRKYAKAVASFQEASAIEPDNANILVQLGSVYMDDNKAKEAFDAFQRVVEIDPENHQVYGKLGQHFENLGEIEKAIENYTRQLEIDPSDYYFISRGLLYFQTGAYDLAEKDYEAAKSMEEGNGYAYYNHARIFMAKGCYEEAELLLRKSIEVSGDSPAFIFYRYLARCYSRMNRIRDAVAVLQEAKDKQVGNPASIERYCGDICATHGYSEEALAHYAETQRLLNRPFEECYEITEIQVMQKRKNLWLLERELANKKQLNPKEVNVLRSYANVLLLREKFDRAACEWEKLMEMAVMDGDRIRYAKCLQQMKHEEQMDKQLQIVEKNMHSELSDYQERRYAFFRLAQAKMIRGEVSSARKYLEQMEAAPICDFCNECGCYEKLYLEGLLAKASGEPERAQMLFLQAYEICKNDLDLFASLGGKK